VKVSLVELAVHDENQPVPGQSQGWMGSKPAKNRWAEMKMNHIE